MDKLKIYKRIKYSFLIFVIVGNLIKSLSIGGLISAAINFIGWYLIISFIEWIVNKFKKDRN